MMQPSIKPADEHSAGDIIARIGSLTRMLRDSLRELGLDQAIAEAAEAIPDARDRLYYVVQMTAQAAERALNSVEASQPHQDQMEKSAKALTQRWDDWFADPIDLADARDAGLSPSSGNESSNTVRHRWPGTAYCTEITALHS